METRENSSGFLRLQAEGLLPLFVLASLSVIALLWVLVRGISQRSALAYGNSAQTAVVAKVTRGSLLGDETLRQDMAIATSSISMLGPSIVGNLVSQYQHLKETNSYTPEAAGQAAERLAQQIYVPIAYKRFTADDIQTTKDTSYKGMLAYRNKLKDALTPMTEIKELEIAVFAKYAQSKDPSYRKELQYILDTYQNAIDASAAITVPKDAVQVHVAILNAMAEFSTTLQTLVDNVDDPLTVVTLLRSYNDAENAMITSFNALAQYYTLHSTT